jgi:hypothetical protein
MILLVATMAGGKRTYGCNAAMEELGEETAVQSAVRGSGEFPPTRSTSPARQVWKGEVAAAAMVQMEVSRWRCGGEEEKTPCAPIYSARW